MKREIIISNLEVIGGSPRLKNRRLDVAHVLWGITEYDKENIDSYKEDFNVTETDIRHAIMYCKDQICELKRVPQSCNGCSKKFRNDFDTWEEYVEYSGGHSKVDLGDQEFDKLGENHILLDSGENHKDDFEGKNYWEKAENVYEKYKERLDLPISYERIIDELGDDNVSNECNL